MVRNTFEQDDGRNKAVKTRHMILSQLITIAKNGDHKIHRSAENEKCKMWHWKNETFDVETVVLNCIFNKIYQEGDNNRKRIPQELSHEGSIL